MKVAPRPIRALPDHLINQIAAGEVIERPLSVVKELVENSLDAGAARIQVDLASGGIERIVVSDDGSGITVDQIGAALTRHCTSKIASAADLEAIVSLGFRGEALASIAAVADVELTTRTDGGEHAWRASVAAGGPLTAPVPARGARGTRVEVRRLFHNVPARKRFLKQPRTEYLHVYRLLRQLAFARPEVSFVLAQAGSRGLRLQPATRSAMGQRWQALFGTAFCDAAVAVAQEIDGIRIEGWVAPAVLATNLADTQFLALNGRMIRDKPLQHAIRLAYADTIPAGRFPAYALALSVAPDSVDVNVHPGKLEVRFADVRSLHDVLHQCVRHALRAEPGAEETSASGLAENRSTVRYAASPAPTVPAAPMPPRAAARQPARAQRQFGSPLLLVDDLLVYQRGHNTRVLDLAQAWRAIISIRLGQAPEVASRPLLLPERLRRAPTRAALVALQGLGFEITTSDVATIVRSVPALLPALDYAAFCSELEAALEECEDAVAACAKAAGNSLPRSGERIQQQSLDALCQAASACEFDLDAAATELTATRLRRLFGDAG